MPDTIDRGRAGLILILFSVPIIRTGYFAVECCRVYANATDAFEALSAYDPCWFAEDELRRCAAAGHAVPRARATGLSDARYAALVANMSYADAATPHL